MAEKIDPQSWISQSEAAEIRGVSRQAIHELVQKGRFRTLEMGSKKFVLREDVVSYEPRKGGRPRTRPGDEVSES
jgi:predicted site-specific integrase-resolvase